MSLRKNLLTLAPSNVKPQNKRKGTRKPEIKCKNKRSRANLKYQFTSRVPNTSFIMNLCKNNNKASFWCIRERYSNYVFFMKINKSKLGFTHKIDSKWNALR